MCIEKCSLSFRKLVIILLIRPLIQSCSNEFSTQESLQVVKWFQGGVEQKKELSNYLKMRMEVSNLTCHISGAPTGIGSDNTSFESSH